MLINRITSVVAAIYVVLLFTNTFALSFHSNNLWSSGRLMHHNDNHGNWLALTSAGVRQAKADMVPSMSSRNQLDGAPFLPTGERRNLLHVIYQRANSQTTTESDVLNKLPIPLNFSFDGISRSTHLIENTSPQRYLELSTAKGNHLLTGKQSQSWFESSPEDSSTTASPNSHRPKRETFQLDNHSRMVIMMPRDTHRMMILNDTKIIAKALPNDSNPSSHFVLINIGSQPNDNLVAFYSKIYAKFVCFDEATSRIVARECFDFCLCGFNQTSKANNFFEFTSISRDGTTKYGNKQPKKWKLGFNGPKPINSATFKRNRSRKFQFTYITIEGQIKGMSNLLVEKRCGLREWERLGIKVFEPELKDDPKMVSNLINHHTFPSTPEQCRRRLKKMTATPRATTTLPTPGTTQENRLQAPSPRHNSKRSKGPSANGSMRCIGPYDRRRKVRHGNKKRRTSSC